MTKHDPIENAIKYQLSIEDPNTVDLSIGKLIEENVALLHRKRILVEEEPEPKVVRVPKKIYGRKSRLARVTQRLCNIESNNEPERKLNIDLDLYQMEDY